MANNGVPFYIKKSNTVSANDLGNFESYPFSNGTVYFTRDHYIVYDYVDGNGNERRARVGAARTNSIYYVEGLAGQTAGNWIGTIDEEVTELYDGLTILFLIQTAGSSSSSNRNLKNDDETTVTSTDAIGYTWLKLSNSSLPGEWKKCYYNATTNLTTQFPASSIVILTYQSDLNGNRGGWRASVQYYANDPNYRTRQYYMQPYAAEDLYRYKLVALDQDHQIVPLVTTNQANATLVQKTQTAKAFRPESIYYYATTAKIVAGAQVGAGALYSQYGDMSNIATYTFNTQLEDNTAVYLIGDYNYTTELFTLDQTNNTSWYTYVPINTNVASDLNYGNYFTAGKYYILVGYARINNGNYCLNLLEDNTLFYYDGTNLSTVHMSDHYHTSGTWNNLTYTASAHNGAGELAFTIPTGNTSATVALGNDPRLSDKRDPNAHASTSSATYGASTLTKYGHAKLVSGDLALKTSYIDGEAAASSHLHSQYLTSADLSTYKVTVTLTGVTTGIADKSSTEIKAAIDAGKTPVVYCNYMGVADMFAFLSDCIDVSEEDEDPYYIASFVYHNERLETSGYSMATMKIFPNKNVNLYIESDRFIVSTDLATPYTTGVVSLEQGVLDTQTQVVTGVAAGVGHTHGQYVDLTSTQTISGLKQFTTRPTLNVTRLPNTYKEVSHLSFNGSNAYTNTGLVITVGDNLTVEMDVNWRGANTSFATFFGYMASSTTPRFAISIYQNKYMMGINTSTQTSSAPVAGRHKFKFYTNPSNHAQKLEMDGVVILNDTYASNAMSSNTLSSYIAARNTGGSANNFADIDVYSVRVVHNSQVYTLVPCYRVNDNQPGFYDITNSTFLPSTGTVTVGSLVEDSEFLVGADLKTVAFTGSYLDLTDTPLLPTNPLIFKGVITANNQIPGVHEVGWVYKIGAAGTYAGKPCEIGDTLYCISSGTTGNDAHWEVIQANIDKPAYIAGNTVAANHIALFEDASGKLKDSSRTISSTSKNVVESITFTQGTLPTFGTDKSVTKITSWAAGTLPTFSATTASVGVLSSAGTDTQLGTAIAATNITAWSEGTLPTFSASTASVGVLKTAGTDTKLGTAIAADDITAWSAGTLPTYTPTTASVGVVTSAGTDTILGTAISADDITEWDAGSLPTYSHSTASVGVITTEGTDTILGTPISADKVTTWTQGTLPTLTPTTASVGVVTNAGTNTVLGTAIAVDDITAWDAGSAPTLTSASRTASHVKTAGSVPISAAVATTKITSWVAGASTSASQSITYSDGILIFNLEATVITSVTAPTLGYDPVNVNSITNVGAMPTFEDVTATEIQSWDAGSAPTLSYDPKSVPNVVSAGTAPTVTGQTVVTGTTFTQGSLPVLIYDTQSIPNVVSAGLAAKVATETVLTGASFAQGSLPSLIYTARSIPNVVSAGKAAKTASQTVVTGGTFTQGSLPSLEYTARSIPNVVSAGTAATFENKTVVTGTTFTQGTLSSLSYDPKSIPMLLAQVKLLHLLIKLQLLVQPLHKVYYHHCLMIQ